MDLALRCRSKREREKEKNFGRVQNFNSVQHCFNCATLTKCEMCICCVCMRL